MHLSEETMEHDIKDAMASFDQMPKSFRDQVKKLRDFRDQMRSAGALAADEQFASPLMERLETPRTRDFQVFQTD
jgi:hypothetical protein